MDSRSVSQAVVTAIALGEDGRKHLVGLGCVDTESRESRRAFLASARARGPSGLVMCFCVDHAGLVGALGEAFQGVAWWRRTVHLRRNVSAAVSGRADERCVRELVRAATARLQPGLPCPSARS